MFIYYVYEVKLDIHAEGNFRHAFSTTRDHLVTWHG